MDPMTMMMLLSAVGGGVKGASDAKKQGESPFSGFLSGALGAGGKSALGGLGKTPAIGNGGAGFQLPQLPTFASQFPASF